MLSLGQCQGEDETAGLRAALVEQFGLLVVSAEPAKELAGVRNGYDDFQRLGLDRWLALLGGYHLAKGACVVIDFGTAVTADFVAADGAHLGVYLPWVAADA